MGIDSAKSISLRLREGQKIAPLTYRGAPRNLIFQEILHDTLPALELGQELDAVIMEELEGGRLLLKLGDLLVHAEGPGGLAAGQHLRLSVEQLRPRVMLHISAIEATIEAETAQLFRAHLPAYANSGELMGSLQSELNAFVRLASEVAVPSENFARLRESIATLLAVGTPPIFDKLETLTRLGGLFYEASLFEAASANNTDQLREIARHDFKGLLLSVQQESKGWAFSEGLQTALASQLENIETQQITQLLAQLDGGALQIQIPLLTGSHFSTAALSIERDGQEHSDNQPNRKDGYSLFFLLDLENFGRMRIDSHLRAKEIRAIFYVDQETSLQLLRHELLSFRDTLLALGYPDALLAAKPMGEMPIDRRDKFAWLAAGAPSSIHLLDMRA